MIAAIDVPFAHVWGNRLDASATSVVGERAEC